MYIDIFIRLLEEAIVYDSDAQEQLVPPPYQGETSVRKEAESVSSQTEGDRRDDVFVTAVAAESAAEISAEGTAEGTAESTAESAAEEGNPITEAAVDATSKTVAAKGNDKLRTARYPFCLLVICA